LKTKKTGSTINIVTWRYKELSIITILKSLLISIVITLAANSVAMSQNREFTVGTIIGFNGVHIQGEIKDIYSPSNGKLWGTGGFSFGFNVKREFSKNTYGAFEMRYSRKGSLYEFITICGTRGYESIRLDYIELPILFGLKINLNKKYLFFETGLSYARLINSKMSVNDFNWWDTSSKLNNFKKNDLSWIANLKYPIIKSEKILLGFRFSYSLISIHSEYKLYNMDYGIEIYYLFNKNIK